MRNHEEGHRGLLQRYAGARFGVSTVMYEAIPVVLSAQEKRSVAIKFIQASSWNKELAGFSIRFTGRRDELQFALSVRTAATVEEMSKKCVFVSLTEKRGS